MDKVKTLIRELELTQTTRFVLPMLYTKDRGDDFFITKNFKNCYIGDANHPELGDNIYILYDYNSDYDYSDNRQVMHIFKIPEEHSTDFLLFKSGDYTKFSEKLKQKILLFWKVENQVENNTLRDILYGIGMVDDDMKEVVNDGQVWPKPIMNEEIYKSSE
jgi:hypothetical protein